MKIKQVIMLLFLVTILLCCCGVKSKTHVKVTNILSVQEISNLQQTLESELLTETIKFSSNDFYLKMDFSKDLTLHQVKEVVNLNTRLKYLIYNPKQLKKSKQWYVKPINWQVNDKALVTLNSLNNKSSFWITKVNEVYIMNKIIISPLNRYEKIHNNDNQHVFLLNDSKIRYVFSKAMHKSSVTALISKAVIKSNYAVSCEWESATSLVIQFLKQTEDEVTPIKLNLTGAKDLDGTYLIDNEGLVLKLVKGNSLAKYNEESDMVHSVSGNLNIDQALVSYQGDKLIYTDVLAQLQKDNKMMNISLNLLNSEDYQVIMQNNKYSLLKSQSNLICSASQYFFYKDTIYNKKGEIISCYEEDILAADFSSDEKNIVFIFDKNNCTYVKVYDILSKSQKYEFQLKTNYLKEHKPKIFFLDNENILFEEDQKLIKLNIINNSKKTVLYGSFLDFNFNNLLSPTKTYLLYKNLYNKECIFSFLKNKNVYSFKKKVKAVSWLATNERVAFSNKINESIKVLNINTKKIKQLSVNGLPVGWDKEGNLLIVTE
ncbi:hypothetical protein IMX26_06370 [Clostridium sp. 'deep sea']|uniref:hypothetical protein n=1 Tax=Clostridium sp. 'deep sea' TaxID=2779445 RepID=UPI0018968AA1|nr:hypothetical protein [Clostridium sp. 'deep sea']QOR36431.1 hypothetical protein IMX26_06370 [Clostridium sp. 'deep sea']